MITLPLPDPPYQDLPFLQYGGKSPSINCYQNQPERKGGSGRGRLMIREIRSKKLTITIRKKSQAGKPSREQMTPESMIAAVRKDGEGKPFRPLYTRRKLSMKARYI